MERNIGFFEKKCGVTTAGSRHLPPTRPAQIALFIMFALCTFLASMVTSCVTVPKDAKPAPINLEMAEIPQKTFPLFDVFKDGGPPPMNQTVDAFLIGKYEVTQSQFEAVMGYDNSRFVDPQKPKDQASWYEAIVFCNLLSMREGLEPAYELNGSANPADWGALPKDYGQGQWDYRSGFYAVWDKVICHWEKNGYRLPSEMEWRSAALGNYAGATFGEAGDLIEFAGDPNPNVSGDKEDDFGWYKDDSGGISHIVGQKKPNEYGAYDMAGNVWEWCWDWVTGNGYHLGDEINYHGPQTGNGQKIRAGGSWAYAPYFAANGGHEPWCQEGDAGFRVARKK